MLDQVDSSEPNGSPSCAGACGHAPPHMMVKAVVFDFDGTLAATLPRTLRLFPILAREFKFRSAPPEEWESLRALGASEILRRLGVSWWKVPFVLWRARTLLARDPEPIEAFPGVVDLLRELDARGVQWGILTTNGWNLVRSTLRSWGAPEPGWLEAGVGLAGKSKRLRRLASRFEVSAADLLLVGDEVRDVEAASRAGVKMAAVAWGYNTRQALVDANAPCLCDTIEQLRATMIRAEHAA